MTATPQQQWKAQEALRDALREADATIARDTALMDNCARLRHYRQLAKVAEGIRQVAERAQQSMEQLDKMMSEKG